MVKLQWLFLICTLFINMSLGTAQYGKNSNIWYFGYGSGIDFNTSPPRTIQGGKTFVTEGTATYCDDNGDLVIYTDGISIWNKNHSVIPGATDLGGHASSSQSATLVPMPGSNHLFYIFSVGTSLSPTFSYTIIDLNLNGGLGGVVIKNQLLFDHCTESVVAVQHCNKRDFWILAHKENSDEFLVWELNTNGISSNPITQKVGSLNTTANAYGLLKASFDGTKLALCGSRSNYLDLFNFDAATGTISGIFKAKNIYTRGCYGVEFSPNDNLLYFTSNPNVQPLGARLYQLDLRLGTMNAIFNGIQEIAYDRINYSLGAIQYAPNGMMYIGRNARTFLSGISNPNNLGAACNYVNYAIDLQGQLAKFGLPNLIPSQAFVPDSIEVDQFQTIDTCLHQSTLGVLVSPHNNDTKYEWYMGNSILPFNGNQITIDESGLYSVIVTVPRECKDSIYIFEFEVDIPDVIEDPTLRIVNPSCQILLGQIQVEITIGNGPFQYSIDDGTTYQDANEFKDLVAGKYTLTIKDANGCLLIQDFEILAKQDSPIIERIDVVPSNCSQNNGEISVFINTNEMVTYSINGMAFQASNKFVNLPAGRYVITIKDQNDCLDSKIVEILDNNNTFFQEIEIMSTHCGENNGVLNIIAEGEELKYSLNGSSFDEENYFENLAAGIYEIQIIDKNGCLETRKAQVLDSEGVVIDQIEITSAHCNESNGSVKIVASGGTGVYKMVVDNSDIYDILELNNLERGEYPIEVSDEIGCRADTIIKITQVDCPVYIPNSFSPNGDGINDVFKVFLYEGFNGTIKSLRIFDRWGNSVFNSSYSNNGWDGKYKGKELNPGVFVYLIEVENEGGNHQLYKGDLSLVR